MCGHNVCPFISRKGSSFRHCNLNEFKASSIKYSILVHLFQLLLRPRLAVTQIPGKLAKSGQSFAYRLDQPWSFDESPKFTLWRTNKKLLKMAIEIVDSPMKNGDFPWFFVCLPAGNASAPISVGTTFARPDESPHQLFFALARIVGHLVEISGLPQAATKKRDIPWQMAINSHCWALGYRTVVVHVTKKSFIAAARVLRFLQLIDFGKHLKPGESESLIILCMCAHLYI